MRWVKITENSDEAFSDRILRKVYKAWFSFLLNLCFVIKIHQQKYAYRDTNVITKMI